MTSFWKRFFGKGAPPESPPTPLSAANDAYDVLTDIGEQIRRDVTAGFYPPEEILRSATEVFKDEAPAETIGSHARRCLDESLAAQAAEQASWPEVTDCDRLDAAFAALEQGGIVMGQHFRCCGACGSAESGTKMKAFEDRGGRAYGYGFYHMQDTESAVEGDGLFSIMGRRTRERNRRSRPAGDRRRASTPRSADGLGRELGQTDRRFAGLETAQGKLASLVVGLRAGGRR